MSIFKKTLKLLSILPVLLLSASGIASKGTHWGYTKNIGPENWHTLSDEFKICKAGSFQSPIDISNTIKSKLAPLEFNYIRSALSIINNGHTIQIYGFNKSYISTPTGKYELVQLHLHTPSEHTFQGKSFPMGIHFVHKNQEDKLSVIGVMVKKGRHNPALQMIIAHVPNIINKEAPLNEVVMDVKALIPEDPGYSLYSGSLTTPPCTEGVTWYVMNTPIEGSTEQINKLQSIMSNNARPIQRKDNRLIIELR